MGVSLADDGFGKVGQVRDAVGNVATGDVLFSNRGEDPPEHLLPSTAGGRGPLKIPEGFLRFLGEGAPVGLAEIGEGVVRGFWEVHGERISQLDKDGEVIGVQGNEGEPLGVYGNVWGGYGDVW